MSEFFSFESGNSWLTHHDHWLKPINDKSFLVRPAVPGHPPTAFSLLIKPEGGLWHSCAFWDHHVGVPNTCLAFSSRKIHNETNHTHFESQVWVTYFILSYKFDRSIKKSSHLLLISSTESTKVRKEDMLQNRGRWCKQIHWHVDHAGRKHLQYFVHSEHSASLKHLPKHHLSGPVCTFLEAAKVLCGPSHNFLAADGEAMQPLGH